MRVKTVSDCSLLVASLLVARTRLHVSTLHTLHSPATRRAHESLNSLSFQSDATALRGKLLVEYRDTELGGRLTCG
jgi:hypothetical protein